MGTGGMGVRAKGSLCVVVGSGQLDNLQFDVNFHKANCNYLYYTLMPHVVSCLPGKKKFHETKRILRTPRLIYELFLISRVCKNCEKRQIAFVMSAHLSV
jgi:hypothetical protein